MKRLSIAGAALLAALVLLSCSGQKETNAQSKPAQKQQVSSGQAQAPAFTLKNMDGKDFSLAQVKGKVIILDFWATWCPPCRREIPHFVELQNQFGSKGLQVIGVSVDQEGWGVVKPFMAEQGVNYPVLMYTEEVYNAYQQLLPSDQRGSIPFTFVLDRQGQIRAQFVGYRDQATFQAALQPLL